MNWKMRKKLEDVPATALQNSTKRKSQDLEGKPKPEYVCKSSETKTWPWET